MPPPPRQPQREGKAAFAMCCTCIATGKSFWASGGKKTSTAFLGNGWFPVGGVPTSMICSCMGSDWVKCFGFFKRVSTGSRQDVCKYFARNQRQLCLYTTCTQSKKNWRHSRPRQDADRVFLANSTFLLLVLGAENISPNLVFQGPNTMAFPHPPPFVKESWQNWVFFKKLGTHWQTCKMADISSLFSTVTCYKFGTGVKWCILCSYILKNCIISLLGDPTVCTFGMVYR